MSTRCVVQFCYGTKAVAQVYVHSDGYPDNMVPDIYNFFKAVSEVPSKDTRLQDPQQLAARFVVFKAQEFATQSYRWTVLQQRSEEYMKANLTPSEYQFDGDARFASYIEFMKSDPMAQVEKDIESGLIKHNPLDFITVYVVQEVAGDVEYVYSLDCDFNGKLDKFGFAYPQVKVNNRAVGKKYLPKWMLPEKAKVSA